MLAQLHPRECSPKLVVVTGRGRSGTSWIGRVLAAHPAASYHYETFLANKKTAYHDWLVRLQAGDPTADRAALMALCGVPRIDVDFPPYDKKNFRRYPTWAIWAAFQTAKRAPFLAAAFRHIASERRAPSARVLKEVNFPNEALEALCRTTCCYLIPIIRSPLGAICSALRGYRSGRFPPDDESHRQHTVSVMQRTPIHDPLPPERVMRLGEAAFEALRWRVQTEPLVEFAERYDHSHIVNYDHFRKDPESHARALYEFLGWEISELALSNARGEAKSHKRRDSFYSTDSALTQKRGAHHKYLTADELRECREILSPSPLLGCWEGPLD
jgi:hypothetical protein